MGDSVWPSSSSRSGSSCSCSVRYFSPATCGHGSFSGEQVSERAAERPTTAPGGVVSMKKLLMIGGTAVVSVLAFAGLALAVPTVPAVPVSDYGDSLLSGLGT